MSVDRYQTFASTRYWPQLDGLRVVSIALVLVAHMGDRWIPEFKGALGVIVFFVISGFLITSLLIREETRKGSVSLSGFYVRRIFRIVPMYYLALGLAIVLVFVFDLGQDPEAFAARLPLLATFNGDLAGAGTFVHSWSIGIEEKYYLLWPLIGFALVPLAQRRFWIATALLIACTTAAFIPGWNYFGTYTAILAGCVLAILMHDKRAYEVTTAMARPVPGAIFLALAVVSFVVDIWLPWTDLTGFAHVPFAYAVALAFPAILIGSNWVRTALSWRPLAFVGTRTYGIYLFHVFAIDAVNRIWPDGETNPVIGLLRLLCACLLSYAIAEVLFRIYERPFINLGRRLTHSKLPRGTMPAEPQSGTPVTAPTDQDRDTRQPAPTTPPTTYRN